MTDSLPSPQRVQLRRTKGWRMPPNTVKVDRTTPWGNPYHGGKDGSGNRPYLARLFTTDLQHRPEKVAEIKQQLRGKNLACWCPLPEPGQPDHCHAAVLLKIANEPHTQEDNK